MDYRIGIDVGGTFTDFVVSDDAGRLLTCKVPSTPSDESDGIFNGIAAVSDMLGLALPDLLGQTELIILGTTVVANTMLEYSGASVGMITTKGFRDVVEIRRGYKESDFDLRLPPPYPIVPRHRRLGVSERVDYAGKVVIPLDEQEVRGAVNRLKALGVESIAVCLLFSFANPGHELRVSEIAREEYPEAFVSLSHEVLPQVREFERFSTTVVNAYVTPKLKRYLERLDARLRQSKFAGELFIMQSSGGMMPLGMAARHGVEAALSGPSGGIVAALFLGRLTGQQDFIAVDMGGTSYDVCLVKGCRPELSTDYWLNRYRVALPMIDIHTIGAGGGSIAWVDEGGALRVGPQSAGAEPGPACYGKGGNIPCVTDADLVLGYLNPDFFLGGRIPLDKARASEAIESRVARPLNLSLTEAASGIFRVVNANMTNAIRHVSVMRGRDPREFVLMSFGGAGAVHTGAQAKDLGIKTILIPKSAPMFSALGTLISDFKISRVQSFVTRSTNPNLAALNNLFGKMKEEAGALLGKQDKVTEISLHRFLDMRYPRQVHEVIMPLEPGDQPLTEAELSAAFEKFHDVHKETYGYKLPHYPAEVVNLRLELVGLRKPFELEAYRLEGTDASKALKGKRRVYFEEARDYVQTDIYDGSVMRPGNRIIGPAIVEEPETTIVVYPGQQLTVDEYLTYTVRVE